MLLDDVCPEKIDVEMSGVVQEKHSGRMGIYVKAGMKTVNERPYWTYKSSAIWWKNGQWRLGRLQNIGYDGALYTIPAYSGVCPTSHGTMWLYSGTEWRTGEWLDTGSDLTLSTLGTITISIKLYPFEPLNIRSEDTMSFLKCK